MSSTTETPVLVDLANGQEAAALDHIERALDVLDEAEDFLIKEQRRHAVPSTSDQHGAACSDAERNEFVRLLDLTTRSPVTHSDAFSG